MLPQFTQLCAAQRTGHATQSRPSVWPRGCLQKAWQRVLASSTTMPSARASEERGHNHFWNRVSPKEFFFLILWKAANVLQNKLTRAQYLDEVTWTTKSWLGLQKQRISTNKRARISVSRSFFTRPSQSRL